jgi:hypothetical protein
VGQHDNALARGHLGQQAALRRAFAQQRGGHHGAGQIGFQRQARAERIHREQGVHRAGAEAAMLFRHVERQQAELGELLPGFAAPACGGSKDGAALLEGVVLGHEAADGVFEKLLFFGEREVHFRVPESSARRCSSGSGRAACAG